MSTRYTKAQVDSMATEIGNRMKSVNNVSVVSDTSGARTVTSSDFGGGVVVAMNNASAQTVTINSGVTGNGPAIYIQQGAGEITFAGTSTLLAPSGSLTTQNQNTMVQVTPLGSDTFLVTDLNSVKITVAADQTAFDAATPGPLELVVLNA